MSDSKAVAVRETSDQIRLAAQLPAKFWPDERISAIAKTVAPPGTGVSELALFLSVAHRYELDPFVNEIWLVKDEKKGRLMVMTGRDAYLKIANKDPGFKGIDSGVVYEKDEFWQEKSGGKVQIHHKVTSMGSRGRIVGAYCVSYHESRLPVVVIRTWDHYRKLHGRPTWQSNPDDMLETRVIVACLRRMFNISGIYTEAEMYGVDEGDGALRDFKENENMLQATQERVSELQAQLQEAKVQAEEEGEEEVQEAVVVEEEEPELFPEVDHGPVDVSLDAYIVEEEEDEPTAVVDAETGELLDEPPPTEEELQKKLETKKKSRKKKDAVSNDAGELLEKAHSRYMAVWKSECNAGEDFRHRWQENAIGKESTKAWTLHDYEDAIELLESGDWTAFLKPKGS